MRGALFENLIVSESYKQLFNEGESPELWFWRDRRGHEVDMIVERNSNYLAVEMKSGKTLSTEQFKGLKYWNNLTGDEGESVLIYGGEQSSERNGIAVLPWRRAGDFLL